MAKSKTVHERRVEELMARQPVMAEATAVPADDPVYEETTPKAQNFEKKAKNAKAS